jgi:Flp pilus assembly protein TadG
MSLLSCPITSFRNNTAGSIAVEFALVTALVFVPLLLGTVEYGRLLWIQNSVQYATDAAARCNAIKQASCLDDASTKTFAATQALAVQIDSSAFTVTHPTCGVQVAVSLPYSLFATFPTFTLTGQSCRPTS